ncbi:MAG TPA: PHB depolymerase family esterase, partial [Dermatophilaceae bacterium]|nr:PHB depolymerase family esterase [Dermatophilaceae bacterium]
MSGVGRRWLARRRGRHVPEVAGAAEVAEVGRWDSLVDHGPTGSRSYAVYTPPGLRRGVAVPLVVVLHGCSQSGRDAALGTEVNAFADRTGFVAV